MQQLLPLATLDFSAHAKRGADDNFNKLYLSRQWQHNTPCARQQSTPSFQGLTGKPVVMSLLGHNR